MNDAPDRTDEELARAAKRGDAAAYDALARRYLRPAMALAWQYTRRVEDAEDIVQDAFHRAVRALADYDDRRPFSAWFYTIVRNVARTAISKDGRRAALAPMQQACVRLCEVEGFTSVEAARMLGVSEGTIRTHLHRARHRLRIAMDPEQGVLP